LKIIIFTNNSIRHKFVANSLAKVSDESLIISECNPNELNSLDSESPTLIDEHFKLRYETEQKFFSNNDYFEAKTLPIMYKEASLPYTFEVIKKFNPDMMFVFGASILKGPILSLLPQGRFINLHLGLSPYYRGSGTNFWPFVNKELEYVGSTILHLDEGIDTGDIICHVRPSIEYTDNVHSIGCKVIQESVKKLIDVMDFVDSGGTLNRIKQWEITNPKYYKKRDFNEEILKTYYANLNNGLIEHHIQNNKKPPKLIKNIHG
jgi:methionyl-tRNA formyltransferase|tara:strand:- start:2070 stop:2858 length:789 start_codon:yes stop_codon:yes gene_type:complete